jgi:REP-associated tyrosine transposase
MPARATLHKNIRLPKSAYWGTQFYFVTICCNDRDTIFADPAHSQWFLGLLRGESAARDFAVHAYCIMPDHFHLLAEGTEPTSDLLGFIRSLKLKSSRIYAEKTGQVLWQKKYFDHILRGGESPDSVAWYVWMNPVRAGLAATVDEYLFAGSFTGLAKRLIPKPDSWTPPWRHKKAPASEGVRYRT